MKHTNDQMVVIAIGTSQITERFRINEASRF